MKIILDNIIFSLQKSGGISTLWGEFILYLQAINIKRFFLEYPNSNVNIVRQDLHIDKNECKTFKTAILPITRFFNPQVTFKRKHIFISSYYRYSRNPNSINVTIVHDFTYEYYRKGMARWIHTLQKRNAIRHSKGVICISENTKKDLLKFCPEAGNKNITVIHNGVADVFKPITHKFSWKEIKTNLHSLDNKKCILFVGSRAGYKNFQLAAEAFSKLSSEYHFIIVGPRFTIKETRNLQLLVPEDRYTILENVSNHDLNKIYNSCFVLLYPSAYEGFGIPILEAMATGLPVIAMKRSSIPEVVGDEALLLKTDHPEEIVAKITQLDDVHLYEKLRSRGLEQSAKFSWKNTMEQYIEFFKKLYNEN